MIIKKEKLRYIRKGKVINQLKKNKK